MIWLVLLRWMHLIGAILLVGSALFYWRAVWPGLADTDADDRKTITVAIRPNWARLVMVSIALLLLSGLANVVWMAKAGEFKAVPGWYHGLLLIKILLALRVFYLMSLITGRSARAERLRENSPFWLSLTSVLAVNVVLLAGVMKSTPRTHSTLEGDEPVAPVVDTSNTLVDSPE